jgi:hypothetical protein
LTQGNNPKILSNKTESFYNKWLALGAGCLKPDIWHGTSQAKVTVVSNKLARAETGRSVIARIQPD